MIDSVANCRSLCRKTQETVNPTDPTKRSPMPVSFNTLNSPGPNSLTLTLPQILELKSDCEKLQSILQSSLINYQGGIFPEFHKLSEGVRSWLIHHMPPLTLESNLTPTEEAEGRHVAMSAFPAAINTFAHQLLVGLKSKEIGSYTLRDSQSPLQALSVKLDKLQSHTADNIIKAWVEQAPQGEDRISAGIRIRRFVDAPDATLRSLNLSDRGLTSLPDVFAHVEGRLDNLDLRGNNFKTLPQDILRKFRTVDVEHPSNSTFPLSLFNDPSMNTSLKIHLEDDVIYLNNSNFEYIRPYLNETDTLNGNLSTEKIMELFSELFEPDCS